MINSNGIKQEIDLMVETLSRSLTPEEIKAGWNDALRQRWRNWFIEVKNKIETNIPFKRSEVNVAFGLGHAGVEPCTLTNRAERIGMMLMELASETSGI